MRYKTKNSHSFGSDYGPPEEEAVLRVLRNGAPTCDQETKRFGEEFAAFCGARFAFPVSSCVGGLHLALLAAGLQPGDEVLVPAMTFRATANVPDVQGYRVVFVDCRETFNIDPDRIEEKITDRTRAIMPVHVCGQPCQMDEILAMARKHKLVVIEDAAHAAGAAYRGKPVGSLSDFAAFSFQQSKNMSTLGEGGMVTTNDEACAYRIKDLRSNGEGGLNYRLTDIQSAAGRIQLQKLPAFIEARAHNAHFFREQLADVRGVTIPDIIPNVKHSWHLCNVLVDEEITGLSRDRLIEVLDRDYGIRCITQYSPPVHLQTYYRRKYNHREGDFPVAEKLARRVVTLPICPRMTLPDLEYCVDSIKKVLAGG